MQAYGVNFPVTPGTLGMQPVTQQEALSTEPPAPPPPPAPASPPPSGTPTQNSGSKKLSGGDIAGIVIGAVVFVAIVGGIIATIIMLQHAKSRQTVPSPQFMSGQGQQPFTQGGSPVSPVSPRSGQ